MNWANIYTIDTKLDYFLDMNHLEIPPTSNVVTGELPTKETLESLERIKAKNIAWYERLYKEYPLQDYLEKKAWWESCQFKKFTGTELVKFLRGKGYAVKVK